MHNATKRKIIALLLITSCMLMVSSCTFSDNVSEVTTDNLEITTGVPDITSGVPEATSEATIETTNITDVVTTPLDTTPNIPDITTITSDTTINIPDVTAETPETTVSTSHAHTWSKWTTSLTPSCTEAGMKERICLCGEVETHAIDALGHTELISPAVASTCTTNGLTEGRYCGECGLVLLAQMEISPLGHDNGEWIITKEADAETEGEKKLFCTICKAILKIENIPATGHTPGKWIINRNATCTQDGERHQICSVCSKNLTTQIIPALGHKEVIDHAVAPTCTSCGLTEGRHCSVCNTVTIKQTKINALGHKEIVDRAIAPTCTSSGLTEGKHCSVCNTITLTQEQVGALGHTDGEWIIDRTANCTTEGAKHRICSVCGDTVKRETIPLSDHSEIFIKGTPATDIKCGLSDGKKCVICGLVTEEQDIIYPLGYAIIENYSNDYGYNFLGTLENGAALQTYYKLIEDEAVKFHIDTSIDAGEDNVVAKINYAQIGLTRDEAISVWVTHRNDHPLYYWISNRILYTDTSLHITAESEYATGRERAEHNETIYTLTEEFIEKISNENSIYHSVLGLHDIILTRTDYAYYDDGITPREDAWAHNILGVFEKGYGVCESYSETLSLLLNYCDIENVLINGIGNGGRHEWNLIRLDDGNWYWCDPTWNDIPNWFGGTCYMYFCVNDTEIIDATIGKWELSGESFIAEHQYEASLTHGITFLCDIPERSTASFEINDTMVYDKFVIDGKIYTVIGYDAVYCETGHGETVEHNERIYKIFSE